MQPIRFVVRVPALLALVIWPTFSGCNRAGDNTGQPDTPTSSASKGPRTTIQGSAGTLHVDDGGASSTGALPVLFVHAFGGNASQWTAQLAHLRPTRRAVAFDLRAHGASAVPVSGDYSVTAFANDIAAVADSLGLQRFVLVGGGRSKVCKFVRAET